MDNYQLDVDPRDRAEVLRRDQEFRDAIAQMPAGQKSTFMEFLQEATGYSKAHVYKCLKPDADPSSKNFRSLFSYGKSKAPQGLEIPSGASEQDVLFNLKLRIGETVVRGVEAGGAQPRVAEGTRRGEATRDFGNTVTGLDVGRMGKYLLNDKFMKSDLGHRLYFQAGRGVYLQYWHDSPESSGNEDESAWGGWDYEEFNVSDLYG